MLTINYDKTRNIASPSNKILVSFNMESNSALRIGICNSRSVELLDLTKGDLLPHKVVGLTIKKGFTLARAWREYLGLTQKDVAVKMGITQAALSQVESGEKKLRKATLEKLASALGIEIEQLGGKRSVTP